MFESFVRLVREIYHSDQFIPLHAPHFAGNEKRYLDKVIDSTFVSSVGPYVGEFEQQIATYCGSSHAIATVNGTAALHIALLLAGVRPGDEVLTQAVTFVATCNAIHYCGAEPVFLDIAAETLGLSAASLDAFLAQYAERRAGGIYNRRSGRRIAACLPMHSLGHPCEMPALTEICREYDLPMVEDAAEALGSRLQGRHCGTFGLLGVLSFNGNKIITTGGGGMILTDDAELAAKAKHLTTTAKLPHPWKFEHDQIGYNYRMPNLNAALGLAQLEQLPHFIAAKRTLAARYAAWAAETGATFFPEPAGASANYWLNALLLNDLAQRDAFLTYTNACDVMTRPLWELMSDLPMFRHCQTDGLANSRRLSARLVNIPSSVAS
ncbi:LegC family aminotransferase [Methylomonas sp. HYX-M1]|uniref:LegC family aminotransferase n=1 Tax=Methylomonas sp. HYX-M1 TaxID=3139307 RepID=UPI00345B9E32